jgi:hypothetical protein
LGGFFEHFHGFSFGLTDGMKIDFGSAPVLMPQDALDRADGDIGPETSGTTQIAFLPLDPGSGSAPY